MSEATTADDATAVIGESGIAARTASEGVRVGLQLGRYLVIEELGRGGMGVVLRAYDPKLQREVALKFVRADTLDAFAQARLVREARAMARLNHPNVVAVYDVELGLRLADDANRETVVIAMEYVPGTNATAWLREAPRSWREIVAMFLAAGRGLAAAHAEGLLHRDFKLDNVLVGAPKGAHATVRVTDFGLARATGAKSSDAVSRALEDPPRADDVSGELTAAGTVLGTPAYMAPEQFARRELDARADQYSFCVALWRALTDRWPFDGRGPALVEAKRAGPQRWPSDVAVPRHIVEALRVGLRPDPAQRWPTMADLLAELERDPSRRRRRLLALGVATLAALAAWGIDRAQRARTRAACVREGEALTEVWNEARADEIGSAFAATSLAYAPDTWTRVRARIDEVGGEWTHTRIHVCESAEIEHTLAPELADRSRACLDDQRDQLAALLEQLRAPDPTSIPRAVTAAVQLPAAKACADEQQLRNREYSSDDAQERERVRELRRRLAHAAAARSMGRMPAALELAESALADATTSSLRAEAQLFVGDALEKLGRFDEARNALMGAYFTAGAAGRDEIALRAASALAFVVGYQLARPDDGEIWGRHAQMLADRLDASDHVMIAELLTNLAAVRQRSGHTAEALPLFERALAIYEQTLGPNHPQVAASLDNLGQAHHALGAHAEALVWFERGHLVFETALGPDHPFVGGSLYNLGGVYEALGDHARARPLLERSLGIREQTLDADHPHVAASLEALGNLWLAQGDPTKALALHERTLAIRTKTYGSEHPEVAMSLHNIGRVHYARGEYEAALELHLQGQAMRERVLGPDHPLVKESVHKVAATRLAWAKESWTRGEHRFARELATTARDGLRPLGELADEELADVERWLAEHPS